jgi:AcrR family transcriptional regulator
VARQTGHTPDKCPTGAAGAQLEEAAPGPAGWAATVAEHKERTRAQILAAAADLLTARGASELAMTALARRARVSRATLYNYFPSAEHILEALVEAEVAAFGHDLDQRLATVHGPAEQLRETITALIGWAAGQAARRPAPRPRGHTPRSPDIQAIHRPLAALQHRVAAVIAAARDAGALPSTTDPAMAAGFVVTLVFGVRTQLDGNRRAATALHTFVLAGLSAHPPRP